MIDNNNTISKIEDIVEIGTQRPGLWFRGQPSCYRTLLPTAFRTVCYDKFQNLYPGYSEDQEDPDDPIPQWLLNVEQHFVSHFKNKALSVTPKLPDDHMDLILLMRQYGIPTRLLDWTQNVLVALFFAVNSQPGEDAELWVLDPISISDNRAVDILPQSDNGYLKALCSEPFDGDLRGSLAIDLIPIPFVPQHKISRMVAQSSVYTVHPRYCPNLTDAKSVRTGVGLDCHIVESGLKKPLLEKLNMLGINNLTLFPDLEGLSNHLTREIEG